MTYNPAKRISAEDALKQEYFKESPQPIDESMFPTWPAKSEQSRTAKRSPKAPEGGMQFNKLVSNDQIKEHIHHSNSQLQTKCLVATL